MPEQFCRSIALNILTSFGSTLLSNFIDDLWRHHFGMLHDNPVRDNPGASLTQLEKNHDQVSITSRWQGCPCKKNPQSGVNNLTAGGLIAHLFKEKESRF